MTEPTQAQIAMRSAIRAKAHWLNEDLLNDIADAALTAIDAEPLRKQPQAQIDAADATMRPQIEAQLEGLAIGLEQRGEKSAAHIIRRYLALTAAAQVGPKLDELVGGITEENLHPEQWLHERAAEHRKNWEQDTIERCAQELQEMIDAAKAVGTHKEQIIGLASALAAIRSLAKQDVAHHPV